jgi:pyruvate formate lyase activating enzyme
MDCELCSQNKAAIHIRICNECIRKGSDQALEMITSAHQKIRKKLSFPIIIPKSSNGLLCNLCSNECQLTEGDLSFCGLRENINGQLVGSTDRKAKLHLYYDSNPTNCCASWFCPAGTGCGYPEYALKENAERGYSNCSVFFYGCNFNCLFCQNLSHKTHCREEPYQNIESLLDQALRKDVTCLCFFGGSPEPHFPFALNFAKEIFARKEKDRVYRICWEWNGAGNPELVKQAARLSLQTGGIIKFDLKAFHPELHKALTGISKKRTYENFSLVAELVDKRPEVPLLTATTLLVPYYVDAQEVEKIAEFIASHNPDIPYSLLVFHPAAFMSDLPITPIEQVRDCYLAAKKHLTRVNIGNKHLLGLSKTELNKLED